MGDSADSSQVTADSRLANSVDAHCQLADSCRGDSKVAVEDPHLDSRDHDDAMAAVDWVANRQGNSNGDRMDSEFLAEV